MNKFLRRLFSVVLLVILVIIAGAGLLTWTLLRPEKEVYPIPGGPEIIAGDGVELKAVQNRKPESRRWVILVHGYRADHSMMNELARICRENGYNTLQPDNRAHGSSGGDHIGMGYRDAEDLLKWIDYIVETDPHAEIILHGISMGAAAVTILSDNRHLPGNIKAIVADSSYSSAMEYVQYKLKRATGVRARIIPALMSWFTERTAGYSLKEAAPLEHVAESRIPILFIHGREDLTVPVEDAYSLYEAASCTKELYICEEAGHGEAAFLDPERYWDTVFSFIDTR